ncbi:MAG TPA: response regulator [Phycisphaerae bacterium]|nr:response regulator [Phycisphaerae bacterium]
MINLAEDVKFKDRKTVLLVDDDPDFLMQQKVLLEQAGYNVLPAQGEAAAEEVLREHRPDLAVLDVMMEKMDGGFVLSHRIKKNDPSIPVILITSVSSETGIDFDTATAEERSWVKADALLSKPVRFEQLTREIDRLLK